MSKLVPLLSIGSVLGDSDVESMAWKRAISLLGKRIQVAREGLDSPLRVNVVFHADGRLAPNEFEGVRTGRFSRMDSHLVVQAAVPTGAAADRHDTLLGLLQEAVDAAVAFGKAEGIADDLPEVRKVLKVVLAHP